MLVPDMFEEGYDNTGTSIPARIHEGFLLLKLTIDV